MNLLDLPELDDVSVAFSTLHTDKKLLAEAEVMPDKKKWDDLAASLFFNGGKLNYKPDLSEEEITRGSRFIRAWLSSFEPKHEHKTLIAGLVLSNLVADAEVQS